MHVSREQEAIWDLAHSLRADHHVTIETGVNMAGIVKFVREKSAWAECKNVFCIGFLCCTRHYGTLCLEMLYI